MIWYLTPRPTLSPPNCIARITTVISTPYRSCFRIGRESCVRSTLAVLKDSRMFRGKNQWQNSNLMLTRQNYRLGRAVATIWALNIGAAVSDTHTQYQVPLSKKQLGNMQKVTKIDSKPNHQHRGLWPHSGLPIIGKTNKQNSAQISPNKKLTQTTGPILGGQTPKGRKN